MGLIENKKLGLKGFKEEDMEVAYEAYYIGYDHAMKDIKKAIDKQKETWVKLTPSSNYTSGFVDGNKSACNTLFKVFDKELKE